jgi:hypothetical protein
MSVKKPLNFMLSKAIRNLKSANQLVKMQSTALVAWRNIRRPLNALGKSHQAGVFRKTLGLPADVTGQRGKAFLRYLKKDRLGSAKAVTHFLGKMKATTKWSPDALKMFREKMKSHQTLFDNMSIGSRGWLHHRHTETMAMAKEAKERLLHRQINARGKGIRFIRKNGRIIPIRKK